MKPSTDKKFPDFFKSSFYRSGLYHRYQAVDHTSLEEAYFKKFDVERLCIDKVFFVVYDADYVIRDHPFDQDLRDKFIQHIKRSRIKKGRFEQVLRREAAYSSWELQLRGGRLMYFHVNVIHYLQELHNLKPRNVIYDDNFMPVDCKLTTVDYVKALKDFIFQAMELYKDLVSKYWDTDLDQVKFKIVELELPFEIYPASVDDISKHLYSKGIAFRKYNTQSGTLYLNSIEADNEITVNRKYDKEDKVDDTDLKPDILYMNGVNTGKSRRRLQVKIYQKTFGLCRIEFTIYSEDCKQLFDFSRPEKQISADLISFVHFNLAMYDIFVDRYDRSLDDVVQFLAKALKEPDDLIYQLRDLDIFETCKANSAVQRRLTRKGILLKSFDSDGVQKRGFYVVNPIVREFLNIYQAKGNEHFVKNSLYPGL